MKKQFCYAVAASALVLSAGFGCKRPDASTGSTTGNLATVDGEAIPLTEYDNYIQHMQQVEVQVGRQGPASLPVVGSIGIQALKDLIFHRLLLDVAKEDNVLPSDADVEKELNDRMKKDPNFVRTAETAGFSLEQIKDDLRLKLAQDNIVTKGVTVTDAEAKKSIKDNPKFFSIPPQVVALWVVVKDPKQKTAVDKALAGGQAFQNVAMQYSVWPHAKEDGGKFPTTNLSQLQEPLSGWLTNTPLLKATDWKALSGQYAKFYVQSRTPSKPMPIDDALVESVRKDMLLAKGGRTTDLKKRIMTKLASSNIDIQVPWLKEPWKEAEDGLKQELAAANAAGTGGAPGGASPLGGKH